MNGSSSYPNVFQRIQGARWSKLIWSIIRVLNRAIKGDSKKVKEYLVTQGNLRFSKNCEIVHNFFIMTNTVQLVST